MHCTESFGLTISLVTTMRSRTPERDTQHLLDSLEDHQVRSVALMQSVVLTALLVEFSRLTGGEPDDVLTMLASRGHMLFSTVDPTA